MSEAWGTLLIKAPEGTLPVLGEDDEGYAWEAIAELCRQAGIDDLRDSHPLLKSVEGSELMIEEIPVLKHGFTEIEIFGEEWMWLVSTLVKSGQGIELYGSIQHEHNFYELYALGADGSRFCRTVDGEGATSNDASKQTVADWLAAIPEDVRQTFPGAFDLDDDEED